MRQMEQNQTGSATGRPALAAAKALARKVAESDTYKAFETASTAFRGDAQAQKLYHDYLNAQRETQMIRGWGGRDKGYEDRFQRLEKELLVAPDMQSLHGGAGGSPRRAQGSERLSHRQARLRFRRHDQAGGRLLLTEG